MFLNNNMKSTLSLLFLCTIFIFSSCQKDEPDQLVTFSKDEFTEEEINTISARLSDEFANHPSDFPVVDESNHVAAYRYLEQLMNTMVNTPLVQNRLTLNWDIYILEDDNKFSTFGMPNGDIYISTGLLKMIQNESQFIGLIAHEIYYLDNDLVMPKLIDKYGGNVFGDLLLDKNVAELGDIVMDIKGRSYSEKEVQAADEFSINNVCPFEYDAFEFEKLIEYLQSAGVSIEWLDKRQGPNDRLQKLSITSASCDDEEPMEETRYQMFKDNLLP